MQHLLRALHTGIEALLPRYRRLGGAWGRRALHKHAEFVQRERDPLPCRDDVAELIFDKPRNGKMELLEI